MARIRLKHVVADIDRHGNTRYYFKPRSAPRKIRLPGQPGASEFMAAYHACLAGAPLPATAAPPVLPAADAKSVRWLCQQYLAHHAFKDLDVKTRRPRQSILQQMCDMPFSEAGKMRVGDAPFAEMPSRVIRRIRDRCADRPEAANNWLKSIKVLFKWAVAEEYCHNNPAKDVPKIRVDSEGFHTWTLEEVAQFEAAHPVGTMQRLALALLLYTGCRRADGVSFGPQHIKDGWLTYTQNKNRNTLPVTLSLPVLPELHRVIAATPCRHLTFLVSQYGKTYSIEGFGKRWRKWAVAAGLPHCTPHGLRKAGAVRAAENGATAHELMAIFGWKDIKQAERYTRKVVQRNIAGGAMEKMAGGDKKQTNVSHFDFRVQVGGINREKNH